MRFPTFQVAECVASWNFGITPTGKFKWFDEVRIDLVQRDCNQIRGHSYTPLLCLKVAQNLQIVNKSPGG